MGPAPRVIVALLAGSLVGIVVMVAVNVPVDHLGDWPDDPRDYFGFWGVLFGGFAAAFAFGIALAIAQQRTRSKVGVLLSGIVAGAFGLLVAYWNVMWGVPLRSLEGAWLWPLAIVPLLVSVALFRSYRRRP